MNHDCVQCTSKEEWDYVCKAINYTFQLPFCKGSNDCIYWESNTVSGNHYARNQSYKIYDFEAWCKLTGNEINKINKNKSMEKVMLDVLNKTYDNLVLRRRTLPLFMSNPGIGKTSIIRNFAESRGVKMVKITLSQRMPNEVVGGLMPDKESKSWEVYDNQQLSSLNDGDVLFFDEVFNGTLKQTLDAVLNLLEDRMLPSGKKLADVLIVAASNPQGLINLTPQIKERFIRYDLKFDAAEYQTFLKSKYGMPESISSHLCTLINKEKFDQAAWDFVTPRSVEKAINQIGCELQSPYDDVLLPFLSKEIDSPVNISDINAKVGDKVAYLSFLKLIVKNQADNKGQVSKVEIKVKKEVKNATKNN